MEFQPEANVCVELHLKDSQWNEVYTWNKVTTCIHNLFSGSDRWADLYGQCVIKCRKKWKDGQHPTELKGKKEKPLATCNLEFVQASGYWANSSTRNEVRGAIKDASGQVVQNIFGKCTEALYCGDGPSLRCIWTPGRLPEDNEAFYGFSRFACELNEILANERGILPPTDTRLRPDQRCLEEGKIVEAEALKLKLEQAQRERRQVAEETGEVHQPAWFERVTTSEDRSKSGNTDQWTFKGNYWQLRKDPGFQTELDDTKPLEVLPRFVKLW